MTEVRSHLAHSWAVCIIAYWLALAVSLMLGPAVGWYPVLSLAGVDTWLQVGIGASMGVGAGLILASLRRYAYRSTRWRMETVGLILAGGAWMAYGWVATTTFPYGMSGWGQALAFATACALRVVEVRRDERRTRRLVDEGLV